MFTGIVTDLGRVRAVENRRDRRFVIGTSYDLDDVAIGASIACSGVCLTVVEKADGAFAVDASAETLSRSTLESWREGVSVNLERSLRLGDELGGHLVSGHVDAVGRVLSREPDGASMRFVFHAPAAVAPLVARKGSIAVDGVSLTVNAVDDDEAGCSFAISVIPHTRAVTTFGGLSEGDRVNLEVDMLARHLRRIVQSRHGGA